MVASSASRDEGSMLILRQHDERIMDDSPVRVHSIRRRSYSPRNSAWHGQSDAPSAYASIF
eukprot:3941644-Rhodomonas_salina.2